VLPLPLVVFVKNTVSGYDPALKLLALLLIDTVTLLLAPGVSDPPVLDKLTQFLLLEIA
jgi:hypothetical protein